MGVSIIAPRNTDICTQFHRRTLEVVGLDDGLDLSVANLVTVDAFHYCVIDLVLIVHLD